MSLDLESLDRPCLLFSLFNIHFVPIWMRSIISRKKISIRQTHLGPNGFISVLTLMKLCRVTKDHTGDSVNEFARANHRYVQKARAQTHVPTYPCDRTNLLNWGSWNGSPKATNKRLIQHFDLVNKLTLSNCCGEPEEWMCSVRIVDHSWLENKQIPSNDHVKCMNITWVWFTLNDFECYEPGNFGYSPLSLNQAGSMYYHRKIAMTKQCDRN